MNAMNSKNLIISAIASGELEDLTSMLEYKSEKEQMDQKLKSWPGVTEYLEDWKSRQDPLAKKIKASMEDPLLLMLRQTATVDNPNISNSYGGKIENETGSNPTISIDEKTDQTIDQTVN
jgi:hypothetical protein